MRKRSVKNRLLLVASLLFLIVGCTIDSHLLQAVKVDDPIVSEDERDFEGMITSYFNLSSGESTLVRFPNGKKLLIDTGGVDDVKNLLKLLQERHVTKLDYVLISNDLPAYSGGYPFLAKNLQIDTVLLPKLIAHAIHRVIPIDEEKKVQLLSEGDVLSFDTNISLTVFHPSEHLFLSPQDNSLVVQLRQGELHFLYPSGIGVKAEDRMLKRHGTELRSQVLKVADQGSNQASSQPFLTKIDPQVAVIQTGKSRDEMTSGQAEIVERLDESWAETYITGQDGTITILSNGKDYKVLKEKKKQD
ncbi:MBL fold metallo-hydrolase [Brevibacillus humidisoli]|uniref:ComEC/Rec2 family competence protein n=1 Tax=Brevibacillus humidisoli TaxID=2895522 RepID=UPI001E3430AA|nr:MBL fold metallo-hydrolase [Brevibacillus humidisoli]UFJ42742.1 MBL fold metallo-hydrolase [Brevibacillus humidisoli]